MCFVQIWCGCAPASGKNRSVYGSKWWGAGWMAFYMFERNTFMTFLMCLEENGWICFTRTLKVLTHWRILRKGEFAMRIFALRIYSPLSVHIKCEANIRSRVTKIFALVAWRSRSLRLNYGVVNNNIEWWRARYDFIEQKEEEETVLENRDEWLPHHHPGAEAVSRPLQTIFSDVPRPVL